MTDKRSAYNLTILYRMIIALFAGLFLTINSLAAEGVEVSTPSNFVLMSSGGINSTNATGTDGHWNNWDPGNNVWYDSNGIPYYQTVATGEVFHGTNDLLGSPIWAPVAAAGTSDFYGTASANTSSNLLGGSREYYADNFNGDFDADASGLTTSYIDIHDSNFAASKQASVTANNGTVMEMYDNNFNGTTTINAASGGTVNVQIGNSTEMQQLLSFQNNISSILDQLYIQFFTYYSDTNASSSSAWEKQVTINGHTGYVRKFIMTFYSVSNGELTTSTQYVNASTMFWLLYYIESMKTYYASLASIASYRWHTFWDHSYALYQFTGSGETYSLTVSSTTGNFFEFLDNRFTTIIHLLNYYCSRFYYWYYPLKTGTVYWEGYNTDTGDYDDLNLAGVLDYITWYLGQIYNDATNVSQNMHQMTQDIGTAATTFQDLNQKEQVAINQIQQGFETFLPDPTEFQSFRAITWCSNYLQQIYVALGAYGTVIFIALLFGVCLQFIGYFRYK